MYLCPTQHTPLHTHISHFIFSTLLFKFKKVTMKKLFYLLLTFHVILLSSQIARADKDQKKLSVPPNHITVTNVFLRDTTAMLFYVGINTNAENVGGETETVTPFDVYGDPRDGRPPVVEIITTPFSVGMPTFHLPNFDNLGVAVPQTTE